MRHAENITKGQWSFGERSPVFFQFPELLFLDVPGKAMGKVMNFALTGISSNLDKAPKTRNCVRLNSCVSY